MLLFSYRVWGDREKFAKGCWLTSVCLYDNDIAALVIYVLDRFSIPIQMKGHLAIKGSVCSSWFLKEEGVSIYSRNI